MENENVLMLRHHPMNVHFDNKFYTDQTEKDLSEYEIIDVTSRVSRNKAFLKDHPDFDKQVSPFFLGPVTGPDGAAAQIFEIFWQAGKVYPCHDNAGTPNADFFKWRNDLYDRTDLDSKTMRHPCTTLGYTHSACLYFPYFDAATRAYIPLDYVTSRKKVYFPEYAKLVSGTDAFKWMKSLVDEGKKIALVDFDGFNYNETCGMLGKYKEYVNKCKKEKVAPTLTANDFIDVNDMKKAVNCSFMQVGHGFVIKALLQGDLEVVNGEVIDHAGILV